MIGPKNKENLSDEELMRLYEETGDPDYLGIIYHRYMHLVYGVCLKYLKEREQAKDAVMDIFEQLIVKIKGQEIRDFGKWVYVVAKNHCLMQLRKKDITLNHEEFGQVFMESSMEMHPLDDEIDEVQIKKLTQGVDNLPEEQKICIRLFYFESKSYNEIVRKTGYDLKKVKSYIQNGKRNLKIWLEKSAS